MQTILPDSGSKFEDKRAYLKIRRVYLIVQPIGLRICKKIFIFEKRKTNNMQKIEADIFQAVTINYDILIHTANTPFLIEGLFLIQGLKGICTGTANYEKITFREGELCVLMPSSIVILQMVQKDFLARVLYVPPKYLPDLALAAGDIDMRSILKFNVLTLDPQLSEDLEHLHTIILHQLEKPLTTYRIKLMLSLINSYLFIIIGNVRSGSSEQHLSSKERITRDFLLKLMNDYREQKSVDYYAKLLCVSSKHLSKVVKEVSNYTPQQWINRTILLEAQRLLANTTMDVMEIAEKLGYSSSSTLTRFFKNATGITPLQFRKEHISHPMTY